MITKQAYLARRKQLMESMGEGLILLLGNKAIGKNYAANPYRFRQDSTFLYYIGIQQANLAALIDVDNYKTYLFGEDLTMDDIIWTGDQPSIKTLAAQQGIRNTGDLSTLANVLSKAQEKGRTIHYLPPYRAARTLWLSQLLELTPAAAESGASLPLIKAIIKQRSVKEAAEVAEMEHALQVSKAIHEGMMKRAEAGMKEAALAGIAEGIALSLEGDLAYPPIITINGQTLHNHHYDNILTEGQMVLADVGAEVPSNYASDITRTFPVSPTFTAQQKDIYAIVLAALNQSINALKPGVSYRAIHFLACRVIAAGLSALGLMKGDVEAAVQAGAHALFFPHGLGHFIGLDVHDMEDFGEDLVGYSDSIQRSKQFGTAYLRLGKQLEVGNTLTVEPGIYFIPQLIKQWQAERKHRSFINYDALTDYLDFGGIRLEDNVLITTTGASVLGQPIAKSIEAVEGLRVV